jgi:hypothetical protein
MKQVLTVIPGSIDTLRRVLMIQQWSELRNTLGQIGLEVIVIPFSANSGTAFDLPFSEKAFIFGNDVLIDKVKEDRLAAWLSDRGFNAIHQQNVKASSTAIIIDEQQAWCSFGFDGSLRRDNQFEDILISAGKVYRPLEMRIGLASDGILANVFCPLTEMRGLLWYPPAFTEQARHEIRDWYPDAIEISNEDKIGMACSSIIHNDHVIIPDGLSMELYERLEGLNYQVIKQDLHAFIDLGLGCKSLIIPINE